MERILSQDERIRRAEEIYARRQSLRQRTKKATLNVSKEEPNFKLFKRLILQIIVCALIYFIFYLINTTNYSFSEATLTKTEELISQDIDFIAIYNNISDWIGKYIGTLNSDLQSENDVNNIKQSVQDEDKKEEKNENTSQIIESDKTQDVAILDNQESTGQAEIKEVNLSETDRIKIKYSFIVPVKRKNII